MILCPCRGEGIRTGTYLGVCWSSLAPSERSGRRGSYLRSTGTTGPPSVSLDAICVRCATARCRSAFCQQDSALSQHASASQITTRRCRPTALTRFGLTLPRNCERRSVEDGLPRCLSAVANHTFGQSAPLRTWTWRFNWPLAGKERNCVRFTGGFGANRDEHRRRQDHEL
jgi:hypothetical protein